VKGKVLLPGVDVTTFTYNTAFVLNFGNVRLTNELGSDLKYFPGRKSAKFLLLRRDAKGKTLISYLINLKWTTNMLKVTIAGRTTDATLSGWYSILASDLAGNPSGPANGTVDGLVRVAGHTVEFNALPVSGRIVTKNKNGRDGAPFTISKVAIRGTGPGV
jgi:hypothetical protein